MSACTGLTRESALAEMSLTTSVSDANEEGFGETGPLRGKSSVLTSTSGILGPILQNSDGVGFPRPTVTTERADDVIVDTFEIANEIHLASEDRNFARASAGPLPGMAVTTMSSFASLRQVLESSDCAGLRTSTSMMEHVGDVLVETIDIDRSLGLLRRSMVAHAAINKKLSKHGCMHPPGNYYDSISEAVRRGLLDDAERKTLLRVPILRC